MSTFFYIAGAVASVIIIGLFASGCAVVKTEKPTGNVATGYVYYYLPESIIKIHATTKVKFTYNSVNKTLSQVRVIEQSFVGTTTMVADTRELLTLNYQPNAFMSDDIKFGVNEKGLLQSVEATTEDRLPNIIETISQAPAAIAGAAVSVSKALNEVIIIKEFAADFSWYADEITSNEKEVAWVLNGQLDQDGNPAYSKNASFKISTLTRSSSTGSVGGTDGTDSGGQSNAVQGSEKTFNGIVTRPLTAVNLQIRPNSDVSSVPMPVPGNLVVADVSKLIKVPIKRTAFVKRVNKITVVDGVVTSNQVTKPSSVEGFISIPVNVAKLVVSIPAEIIQVKINTAKNKEALEKQALALQQAIAANEKYVFTKEKELDQVKFDLEKAKQDNKSALEILQLSTQKDLLKAEEDLLKMRQELDALKKQIDAQNAKKP